MAKKRKIAAKGSTGFLGVIRVRLGDTNPTTSPSTVGSLPTAYRAGRQKCLFFGASPFLVEPLRERA